jgi:hypothetical protein
MANFSMVWDSSLRNPTRAQLIRPSRGDSAVYEALGVVTLEDGRSYRAFCVRYRNSLAERAQLGVPAVADDVTLYRNGRALPEKHMRDVRRFALQQFRSLYCRAAGVDFDESNPDYPLADNDAALAEASERGAMIAAATSAAPLDPDSVAKVPAEYVPAESDRLEAAAMGSHFLNVYGPGIVVHFEAEHNAARALRDDGKEAATWALCDGVWKLWQTNGGIVVPPAVDPFADSSVVIEYRFRGDGCQAPGALVVRDLGEGRAHRFVVHFRNDQDSERTGRPCYYFGDYCETLAEALEALGGKVRRYDPTGGLWNPEPGAIAAAPAARLAAYQDVATVAAETVESIGPRGTMARDEMESHLAKLRATF